MSGIMEGRVAFVTGGGSGMGRETARLLAEAEARVAVADLNEDGARETAAAIEAAGGRAWATKLDVSDSAAVDAAVSAAAEALGPIDALVNIAGIYQVAEVVRDLTYAQQTKGISPALKRMLSKARLILASELRFALDLTEEDAVKRLDRALPKVEVEEEV